MESPSQPDSTVSVVRGGPRGFSGLSKPPNGEGQGKAGQEHGRVPTLGSGRAAAPALPYSLPGHPSRVAGVTFAARLNLGHALPEGCSPAPALPLRPPSLYLGPLLLSG